MYMLFYNNKKGYKTITCENNINKILYNNNNEGSFGQLEKSAGQDETLFSFFVKSYK